MREKRIIYNFIILILKKMARICYFTGKWTTSWNTRSHSMIASKRRFKPNLLLKKVKLEDGTTAKVKINAKIYKKLKGFI